MLVRSRTAAAFVVAASLLLFTGCSSQPEAVDDDSSQVDDSATDETDTADDTEETDTEDTEEEPADSPAGGAVYTDPAADSVQVAVSETGFDPASVSVPVGGTVTFAPSDDGPHGIYVGDLDGYSAMGGLTATFRFDIAGTYQVYDEISEAEATVVVG